MKLFKMTIISFTILFAVIYFGIMAYMYAYQRSYTFHPSHDNPFDMDYKPFASFDYQSSGGLALRGLIKLPEQGKPTIVYFQGNAGHIGDRLFKTKYFLPHGYGFALVGYRGYSGNPGLPSEKGFYDDARAAIKALQARGIDLSDVIFYGESLGTGVATQMALEHQSAKALILEAPFTSTIDIGSAIYWYLPVKWLMKDRFESVKKIKKIKMPLLIVHGTNDVTIPYHFGEKLFDAAISPRKDMATIDGAGHGDLYDFKAGEAIYAFLERL